MKKPPIPSQLQGKPKEKLDVVFATGAGGKVYAIPTAIAAQHEFKGDHPPLIATKEFGEGLAAGDDDEVGGRHAVLLQDGTFGYHSDWLYGPYIWWRDGGGYIGLHRHPNRYSPLAYDIDD